MRKIETKAIPYSCLSLISAHRIACPTETVDLQEQGKLSDFLKWLTLPILASAIALECFPVTYQEEPSSTPPLK